jgi:hypothetical protein
VLYKLYKTFKVRERKKESSLHCTIVKRERERERKRTVEFP